jgi:hypothetical protein
MPKMYVHVDAGDGIFVGTALPMTPATHLLPH